MVESTRERRFQKESRYRSRTIKKEIRVTSLNAYRNNPVNGTKEH